MARFKGKALAVVAVVAVALRLALLVIPFQFVPDIYYYDAQAVHALATGSNPYGYHYAVPPSLRTPGAENVYAYLPGVVLFLFPFGFAGDVRLGLILCDVLVAFALYLLRARWSTAASAVYLFAPFTVLFSTWYPNNALVGMAFLGLALAAESDGREVLAGLLLGASLASTQLVWLLFPFLAYHYLRNKNYRVPGIGLGVAGGLVAPFFAWDPTTFVHDVVFFEFGRPVQQFLTPEPFGFNVNPTLSGLSTTLVGAEVPFVLKAALVVVVFAILIRRTKSLSGALSNGTWFLLAAIFILPNNFSWWYLELPFQLFLVWWVLGRRQDDETAANA